jgi:hypothetical protein
MPDTAPIARETVVSKLTRFVLTAKTEEDFGPLYDIDSPIPFVERAKSYPVYQLLGPAHQRIIDVIATSMDRARAAETAAMSAILAIDPEFELEDELRVDGGLSPEQVAQRTGFELPKVETALTNMEAFDLLSKFHGGYSLDSLLDRSELSEFWTPESLRKTGVPELIALADKNEFGADEEWLAKYEAEMRAAAPPVTPIEPLNGLPADLLAALCPSFSADEVSTIIRDKVVPADKAMDWEDLLQVSRIDLVDGPSFNSAVAAVLAYRRRQAAKSATPMSADIEDDLGGWIN